jgi:hypothetical protein
MPEGAEPAKLKVTPGTAVQPAETPWQALLKCMGETIHKLLVWFLQLLLFYFDELQDAFLAIPVVRRLVAVSLLSSCKATVLAHLITPAENT